MIVYFLLVQFFSFSIFLVGLGHVQGPGFNPLDRKKKRRRERRIFTVFFFLIKDKTHSCRKFMYTTAKYKEKSKILLPRETNRVCLVF
jgi:hypothetical protein